MNVVSDHYDVEFGLTYYMLFMYLRKVETLRTRYRESSRANVPNANADWLLAIKVLIWVPCLCETLLSIISVE